MLQHKTLGLDVDNRTIGVVVSNIVGWTAQRLDTLQTNEGDNELGIDQLVDVVRKHNVGTTVIRLPKDINNSVGFRDEASLAYREKLLEACPSIKTVMWDERLSTMAAERSLLEADVPRQKRKQAIDKMAAMFILQGCLDSLH